VNRVISAAGSPPEKIPDYRQDWQNTLNPAQNYFPFVVFQKGTFFDPAIHRRARDPHHRIPL